MTFLRSLVAAVALAALAACASLPARPAGGMVADLTEDTPLVSQDGLSTEFSTEAKRIDVQQRAWKVIAERYYDPRLNGVDWAGGARQVPPARRAGDDRRAVLPCAEGHGPGAERLAHPDRDSARERRSSPLRRAGLRRLVECDRRPARGHRCRCGLPGGACGTEARRRGSGDRRSPVRCGLPRRRADLAADGRGPGVAGGAARACGRGGALRAAAGSPPRPAARAGRAAARAAPVDPP